MTIVQQLEQKAIGYSENARTMLQNDIDCSTAMKMIGPMENDPALRIFS